MSRLQIAAARLAPALALALALSVLVGRSSLVRLLPFAWSPVPWGLYAAAAILLALAPAILSSRSPVPAALAVTVPILALAAYDESRLDWLRTLKDFGVTDPGAIDAKRLILSFVALALVWVLHAADTGARLRATTLDRGIPRGQARAGMRLAFRSSALVGMLALAGSTVMGALALVAQRLDAGVLFGGRASLLAPLLAVALVGLAAVLLVGRGTDRVE